MKRMLVAGAMALALLSGAFAQTHKDTGGTVVQAVAPLPFAPSGLYATVSVTTAAALGTAVPTTTAAPVLVVYNNGANPAYVALGATAAAAESAAAVNAVDVVQSGGCLSFRPGSNGYLAAITATSTTSLILSAGEGMPTGCGGGGGTSTSPGGGGVTMASGAVASGAYSTGSIVDLGTISSVTPWHGSGTANLLNIAAGIEADARGALAAQAGAGVDVGGVDQIGSWTVGATQSGSWTVSATQSGSWTEGISQTTPGTTNAIAGTYFYNIASSTLTRASNTVAYAANETVCLNTSVTACAPITIALGATNAGHGLITRVSLLKSGSGLSGATFDVWFFSSAPGVASPAQYDATAYAGPRAGDMPNYIGSAQCNSPTATSDTSAQVWYECTLSNPNTGGALPLQALSGSTNIDALISVTGAYTPASAETFNVYVSGVY